MFAHIYDIGQLVWPPEEHTIPLIPLCLDVLLFLHFFSFYKYSISPTPAFLIVCINSTLTKCIYYYHYFKSNKKKQKPASKPFVYRAPKRQMTPDRDRDRERAKLISSENSFELKFPVKAKPKSRSTHTLAVVVNRTGNQWIVLPFMVSSVLLYVTPTTQTDSRPIILLCIELCIKGAQL